MQAHVINGGATVPFVPAADHPAGDVVQLPDGRAGVVVTAVKSGALGSVYVGGRFVLANKPTTFALLPGGRLYYDHSADTPHFRKVSDRDFYLGRASEDALQAATTCVLSLNIDPPYDVDLQRDPFATTPVGTQALGGFLPPQRVGGAHHLKLSATVEAQKVDLIAVDGFSKNANAIVEGVFRVVNDGAGAAPDFTLGVASGTHASDFQLVAEFVAVSLVGNATAINAQSDDGVTDVAPVATTKAYVEGAAVANRVEVWLDLRDPNDVQVYVDGVNVLPATTFTLAAAAATLFPVAHLEKTATADVYEVAIDRLCARLME